MPYEINALTWKRYDTSSFIAETPFSTYIIRCIDGKWTWGYRNQMWEPAADRVAAKLAAESHWRERVMQTLVEVT